MLSLMVLNSHRREQKKKNGSVPTADTTSTTAGMHKILESLLAAIHNQTSDDPEVVDFSLHVRSEIKHT